MKAGERMLDIEARADRGADISNRVFAMP